MICKKCKIDKPLDSFTKDRRMVSGVINACKECVNASKRASYAKAISDPTQAEKIRSALRKTSREYVLKGGRRSENLTPSRIEARRQRERKHRKACPEKDRARNLIKLAMRSGKVIKGKCEICGNEKVDAHHDDYSKPLDVRWLCRTHHGEVHRKILIKKEQHDK